MKYLTKNDKPSSPKETVFNRTGSARLVVSFHATELVINYQNVFLNHFSKKKKKTNTEPLKGTNNNHPACFTCSAHVCRETFWYHFHVLYSKLRPTSERMLWSNVSFYCPEGRPFCGTWSSLLGMEWVLG